MKNHISLQKISLFISLVFIGIESSAQCKGFVKRADFSALSAFDYCGTIRAAKMYSGDEGTINHHLKVGKRYRIVMNNQKFLGEVNLTIKNEKGQTLGNEVITDSSHYWELMVNENQQIDIILNAPEEKNTVGIASSGCVAVAIGQLDNDELVAHP